MIKETTLELTVNLQNYENLKMSATGDNTEELREYLIDQLNNFGTMDEVVRGCIDSYIKRVLSKPEPPKEITCNECEGQDTELCNTCPNKEECNTDNLNTLTSDSNKTNSKPEIESGQPEGTGFKKASELSEEDIKDVQNIIVDAINTGNQKGKEISKIDTKVGPNGHKNNYNNGMPKVTRCKCGAELTNTDLRLSDLLGIEPCCKECRDKIRGKE